MKLLNRINKSLFFCAMALALCACALPGQPQAPHPLSGKIWDVQGQRFVDAPTVMERATAAHFVLLGEIHDNAEQHRLQTRILDAVIKSGKRPALVMEQFDLDQQEQLTALAHDANREHALQGLAALMRKGWDWDFYAPLITTGLAQQLPLVAANLSREALREVARKGYPALGAGEESRLALEAVWSPERQKQLLEDVTLGHCGKIPPPVVEMIARSQRARDAVMADMLLKSNIDGAVGIIGSGHARYDMGVPLYLKARAPATSILSVGLIEVDTSTDAASYAVSELGTKYDFLWFTDRTQRETDPCDSIAPAVKAPR